ncbi:PKD domain-containing protein [Halomicrobium urmianum]|uniref:PKD domain-containing protein n=1 Tax=Halomicrobium urmianum TaxID=1586233 RepID=UPI001CDA4074|nr:PKD domain-containing protein [Halomicrobium urmianum]
MERFVAAMALAVLVALSGVAAAQGNAPPEAAAGLDQTVVEGATVYLDAGGSRDPDGNLTTYEWEITGPNGSAVAPNASGEQTQFTPGGPGEYEVTLTVTDDDGASRSDVAFVNVRAARAPEVNVTGPSTVVAGKTRGYNVSMDARDGGLRNVTFYRDGTAESTRDLGARTTTVEHDEQLNETGTTELRAVAWDTYGNVGEDTLSVSLRTGPVQNHCRRSQRDVRRRRGAIRRQRDAG